MVNYEQKYKGLVQKLKNAKEIKGGYTFKSVLDEVAPELQESNNEIVRKEIINYLEINSNQMTPKQFSDFRERWLPWLEKQHEQKPTDEVEPKFHDGDWIVYNDNLYYIGNIALQRYYECRRVDGTIHTFSLDIDSKSHLWTIQDAKDGDVLATDDGICIFDGTLEEGKYPFAYCGITKRGFDSYDARLPFSHDNNIHPATKEQRDLLFSKMKDAGYEWDAEKKELKKIVDNKFNIYDCIIKKCNSNINDFGYFINEYYWW